jgi:Cu/Ag efflux protein CusF
VRVRTVHTAVTVIALICLGISCNHHGAGSKGARETVFAGAGVVRNVDAGEKTIEIDHEEIKGYMPAMTMPYHVKDQSLLEKVGPGDKVKFKIEDTGFGPLLIEIDRQPS